MLSRLLNLRLNIPLYHIDHQNSLHRTHIRLHLAVCEIRNWPMLDGCNRWFDCCRVALPTVLTKRLIAKIAVKFEKTSYAYDRRAA